MPVYFQQPMLVMLLTFWRPVSLIYLQTVIITSSTDLICCFLVSLRKELTLPPVGVILPFEINTYIVSSFSQEELIVPLEALYTRKQFYFPNLFHPSSSHMES